MFLRDIYNGNLSLKDANEEESKLVNTLNSINRGVKSVAKKGFLKNIRLFICAGEKILNNFRNKILPIKNKNWTTTWTN